MKMLPLAAMVLFTAPILNSAVAAPVSRQAAPNSVNRSLIESRIAQQFGPSGAARAKLDALAGEDRLSGVVAIALGNKILYSGQWGKSDRTIGRAVNMDTRFDLASTGKLFTAVAIGQLMQQKKIELSDPVGRWVKDLPAAIAALTVEQLLTHRSGLHSYFNSPLWPGLSANGTKVSDYMRAVVADVPTRTGEFQYSNNGYVLLGALVEAVAKEDYYDYVARHIFRPAGMRATGYDIDPNPANALRYTKGCFARPPSQCTPAADWKVAPGGRRGTPAGGAYSTAKDMIRFAQALRSGKLLSRPMLLRMTAPVLDLPEGGPADAQSLGFGRVNVAQGVDLFGHNGGTPGAASQLDMLIAPELTIVVLTNVDGAQRQATAIVRRAIFELEQ